MSNELAFAAVMREPDARVFIADSTDSRFSALNELLASEKLRLEESKTSPGLGFFNIVAADGQAFGPAEARPVLDMLIKTKPITGTFPVNPPANPVV